MKPPYDSVLFDFDGVLADTEPIHWACWREILAPLRVELSWDVYCANCIGVVDTDMLSFLASLGPTTAEALRPHYPRKKELFRTRVLEMSPCATETVELVRSLTDYRLAVVTSSGRQEVEPVLERVGIHECFSTMVFGGDVNKHKPDPEPYLLAASRLESTRPLVVEDSEAGVASAWAAGFDVVRVGSSSEVPAIVRAALAG